MPYKKPLKTCNHNFCNEVLAGDSVFFSKDVWNWDGGPFSPPPHLGTVNGAPDSCLGIIDGRAHTRLVSYYDGYVNNWPPDSIDQRGDLNMNGIANEIADEIMYVDYFLHGLDSWDPLIRNAAVWASDVNADGTTLTFQDAVYLMRIIYGDALPFPKRPASDSLNAYFFQDTTNHRVEVSYDGQLAGAYLLVLGNITPTFTVLPGFAQDYYFDGGITRILIMGDLDHRYSSGIWFTYSGTGTLFNASTTDFFDTRVTSHITGVGIACGDFDGSSSIDVSDAAYLVSFIFADGPPPIDGRSGNANCDGIVNISDVVYLIAYIFGGGSAPCASCP